MDKLLDGVLNYEKKDEPDFYKVLGCTSQATPEQISTEFKARVISCHPDKHPDDKAAHEKFSKLSQAKEVLLDPEKRKDYDKWLNSGIAIPYDQWKCMSHLKTSMHWGFVSPQAALEVPKNDEYKSTENFKRDGKPNDKSPVSRARSRSPANAGSDPKILPFVKRGSDRPAAPPGWEREAGSDMLNKFRNYQI